MKKSTKALALGTAIAAVGGYVAGVLTAPKSGKETRKDIKDAATKAYVEAEKKLKGLYSELSDLIETSKSKVGELKDQSKEQFEKALAVAQKAKDKAKQVLSASHEGKADDKDLKAAIEEANKALANLKKFIKK